MAIRWAENSDLPWINEQYEKIGFVPSSLEREEIAIVTHNGRNAGVGRLVLLNEKEAEMGGIYILEQFRGLSLAHELVGCLVDKSRSLGLESVYCIPFRELEHFYEKFGFARVDPSISSVNQKVLEKYNWCIRQYEKPVILQKLA
ncbi:GNAT family N-acetyltransferase [Paenibacillus azoreducens]|uniref:N-acetyltransferase n=1 Tax=Paenibacillus azoreducens TaxID=116718 RepID=A0A920CQF6_9BACL|nr:GNAT family N-acetyltransferase [Paenibacillus azoreducens]GIO45388.1 N-acetyltransferase [Paenibacillus azoreducens]